MYRNQVITAGHYLKQNYNSTSVFLRMTQKKISYLASQSNLTSILVILFTKVSYILDSLLRNLTSYIQKFNESFDFDVFNTEIY
jgi:hypothetical protein